MSNDLAGPLSEQLRAPRPVRDRVGAQEADARDQREVLVDVGVAAASARYIGRLHSAVALQLEAQAQVAIEVVLPADACASTPVVSIDGLPG